MKKCTVCKKKHNTYYKHRPCCLACFKKALRTEKHFANVK